MRNRLIAGASTGILAGMIFMAGNTVFAETNDLSSPSNTSTAPSGMHFMHRFNSETRAGSLATTLGLDKAQIKQELKSGKTMKQILQEHGIVPDQLHKAFTRKNSSKKRTS